MHRLPQNYRYITVCAISLILLLILLNVQVTDAKEGNVPHEGEQEIEQFTTDDTVIRLAQTQHSFVKYLEKLDSKDLFDSRYRTVDFFLEHQTPVYPSPTDAPSDVPIDVPTDVPSDSCEKVSHF